MGREQEREGKDAREGGRREINSVLKGHSSWEWAKAGARGPHTRIIMCYFSKLAVSLKGSREAGTEIGTWLWGTRVSGRGSACYTAVLVLGFSPLVNTVPCLFQATDHSFYLMNLSCPGFPLMFAHFNFRFLSSCGSILMLCVVDFCPQFILLWFFLCRNDLTGT